MRTLDREYLATHPEGDEKAEFKLTVNVPSRVEVKPNPDGTRPSITVGVTADTYLLAVSLLSEMHDKTDELLFAWLQERLTPEQMEYLEQMPEDSGPVPFLAEAVDTVHDDFLVFETTVEAVLEIDGREVTQSMDVSITAPSVETGVKAFKHLTSTEMLSSVAVNFSPKTEGDEYDEDSDYVLVRS